MSGEKTKYKGNVCIVGGCGHVGLPLGIALAEAGAQVTLFDINEATVNQVARGVMPFMEEGADEVLKHVIGGTLNVTTDRNAITKADLVVVVIGTPVDEHLNPKVHLMLDFFDEYSNCFAKGQTVILRSTVFPGTTEKIAAYLREKNIDVHVAFCPERIAEGRAMKELRTLPQIISGCDETAIEEATKLFHLLTDDVIRLSCMEAELTKLFTNVWRYLQFAVSNQFYMIAQNYGVEFYSIYKAMTKNYARTKGMPRPGFAAGPCLFKDTMQLAAASHNDFHFGHMAMVVNEGLPKFVVEQIKLKHDLKNKTVAILGMAFKGESDDSRESLSYKLKKILETEARNVLCTDPYVKDERFVDLKDAVDRADIVIIGAPHMVYSGLNVEGKILVDIWNLMERGGLIR